MDLLITISDTRRNLVPTIALAEDTWQGLLCSYKNWMRTRANVKIWRENFRHRYVESCVRVSSTPRCVCFFTLLLSNDHSHPHNVNSRNEGLMWISRLDKIQRRRNSIARKCLIVYNAYYFLALPPLKLGLKRSTYGRATSASIRKFNLYILRNAKCPLEKTILRALPLFVGL